jgi:hypothetical protein
MFSLAPLPAIAIAMAGNKHWAWANHPSGMGHGAASLQRDKLDTR